MSPVQQATLDFIRQYTAQYGESPSYSLIASQLGMKHKAAAFRLVDTLITDGRLIKRPALAIVDLDVESSIDRVCEALLTAFQFHDGDGVLVVADADALKPVIARVLG